LASLLYRARATCQRFPASRANNGGTRQKPASGARLEDEETEDEAGMKELR
jgi:hypothetical protein